MVPSVIEIFDLGGAGELLLTDVPDPVGAVAHDDFDLCAAPATLMGFGVDAAGELSGCLDGSGVSRGILIARGPALVVRGGLSEDAT
jgi:hypothetical protein